ncbi:MAG: LysE/ArgO family amino acid transporter [Nesterenkonia sp.]
MLTVLLTGFFACLAIIVAIGPQSAYLLRQGLRRDRVMLAVLCCLVGDALLLSAGTAGVGVVLEHAPWLLDILRWAGVAYLTGFAYRSFRSAHAARQSLRADDDARPAEESGRHASPEPSRSADPASTVHILMTSEIPTVDAAVDPAVDPAGRGAGQSTATQQKAHVTPVSKVSTVAGTALALSIVNPHAWVDSLVVLGTMANTFADQRWLFAAGAFVACIVWHTALAGGGSALAAWLNRPRTWQYIDLSMGAVMLIVAALLAVSGF